MSSISRFWWYVIIGAIVFIVGFEARDRLGICHAEGCVWPLTWWLDQKSEAQAAWVQCIGLLIGAYAVWLVYQRQRQDQIEDRKIMADLKRKAVVAELCGYLVMVKIKVNRINNVLSSDQGISKRKIEIAQIETDLQCLQPLIKEFYGLGDKLGAAVTSVYVRAARFETARREAFERLIIDEKSISTPQSPIHGRLIRNTTELKGRLDELLLHLRTIHPWPETFDEDYKRLLKRLERRGETDTEGSSLEPEPSG